MIHVDLFWWVVPVLMIVCGGIGSALFASRTRDYDFGNAVLSIGCLAAGFVAAVAFTLGHFLG